MHVRAAAHTHTQLSHAGSLSLPTRPSSLNAAEWVPNISRAHRRSEPVPFSPSMLRLSPIRNYYCPRSPPCAAFFASPPCWWYFRSRFCYFLKMLFFYYYLKLNFEKDFFFLLLKPASQSKQYVVIKKNCVCI